ncbi:hypothetical protein GW933_02170 [Candidatus Falkowbacteria bacterium]|uniref:Phosphoribulokinase/uridine kinase domain-containing protein n=1 Tax=Candidatus Buchananbacteria bacterium CG10_big_fil_rev_8_21_14_0_10_33_19 TaxID=1974525 RepID=A0A2H0W3W0_9BACT|nr:hypothetical protein [Candidatus Falkowbacteria bacterium]PIS06053.1 MAG: hypothetical protein COT80_04795 [Candidatus Buchananbacteria bacterium CG10_big_fil_rev_8_21_14_0_10_33_19]
MVQISTIGVDNCVKDLTITVDIFLKSTDSEGLVIAIAGGTCSGKSSLAIKLAQSITNASHSTTVLNLDDYYKDYDHPDFPFDAEYRAIYDLPQSYLLAELRRDLKFLLAGKSVKVPTYDKKISKRLKGKKRLVGPSSVIIVEGLFAIVALQKVMCDIITIFIDTDHDIMVKRRLKRDVGSLHKTPEEALAFIVERVDPYFEEYVKPQKFMAKIVLINND